jgi:hypothetical protein
MMQPIFQDFTREIGERLSSGIHTTEDDIRYTFFYCLMQSGYRPIDVLLEYPHPAIRNARVDTYVPAKDGNQGMVVEFKYDRSIPSGNNTPRTQKAGRVFADLFRLAQFDGGTPLSKYFVYVTDGEMATYFLNRSKNFDTFFQLPPGKTLIIDRPYIENHASTFTKSIGHHFTDCSVTCVIREDFGSEAWLRIYQIHAATG